jgi:hypothetical protein
VPSTERLEGLEIPRSPCLSSSNSSFLGDLADVEQLDSLEVVILGLSLMDRKYFPQSEHLVRLRESMEERGPGGARGIINIL